MAGKFMMKTANRDISMIKNRFKSLVLLVIFGMGVHFSAFGQAGNGPFFLHYTERRPALPMAIYDGIRIKEFRRLLIEALQASNFTLVEVTDRKEAATILKFSYPMGSMKGVAQIFLVVRVDENSVRKDLCGSCFLREPELVGTSSLKDVAWMSQYELSNRLFPDMDRAFDRIKSDGKNHMDGKFGFNYVSRWKGERNFYGNSFVGIRLPDLKALVVQSYSDAGFYFMGDENEGLRAKSSFLTFNFPVDPERNAGAVYKVGFSSQFDDDGFCYPCEVVESYDPHQSLPASGLMGMANRLTLASRFAAGRALAHEKLKASTEKYLRPGSGFFVPPQQAPLGSPRPPILPPAAT